MPEPLVITVRDKKYRFQPPGVSEFLPSSDLLKKLVKQWPGLLRSDEALNCVVFLGGSYWPYEEDGEVKPYEVFGNMAFGKNPETAGMDAATLAVIWGAYQRHYKELLELQGSIAAQGNASEPEGSAPEEPGSASPSSGSGE
jgi:hypothetical protein